MSTVLSTEERPVSCSICHKEFSSSKQLDGHKKACSLFVHKKEAKGDDESSEGFIISAKTVKNKPRIPNKKKRGRPRFYGSGPPFICDICNISFPIKRSIYNHMSNNHSVARPLVKTVCDLCGASVQDIKAHLLVHSIERPFSCDVCGSNFKKKNHLTTHRLIHTGEKPHTCPTCNKGFAQRGDMYKHAKKSHNLTIPRKKIPRMSQAANTHSLNIQDDEDSAELEFNTP